MTIVFVNIPPLAICLDVMGRKRDGDEAEKVVHVAEYGNDETGTRAGTSPTQTISHATKTAPGSLIIVGEGKYEPFELGPDCSGRKTLPL